MDITSTFTKKNEEPTYKDLKDSLENLLSPLSLDKELENVIISSIAHLSSGPVGPVIADSSYSASSGENGPSHPGVNGSYSIVVGPDGEKYYVDNTGLFINVNDIKNPEELKNLSSSPENIVEVVIKENANISLSGISVAWGDDKEKIIATINVPEGMNIDHVNTKYIFEYFTMLGVKNLNIHDACTVSYSLNDTPTCSFYTAKINETQLEPSRHYRFDRPSKYNGTCSNELVIKSNNSLNPVCMYDMNFKSSIRCDNYQTDNWETKYTTTSIEGRKILIQSRRYAHGHMNWRAIDDEDQAVIFISKADELSTSEKAFFNLLDSLDKLTDEIEEVAPTPIEPLPQDKVYTHHVANIN